MKTKDKGDIRNTGHITAKGIQLLNGDNCFRFSFVPIVLLDYTPPDNAHPFAKGERFKFWIKLEDSSYKQIQEQMNKDLKEISIWFDEDNKKKLLEFLKESGE